MYCISFCLNKQKLPQAVAPLAPAYRTKVRGRLDSTGGLFCVHGNELLDHKRRIFFIVSATVRF